MGRWEEGETERVGLKEVGDIRVRSPLENNNKKRGILFEDEGQRVRKENLIILCLSFNLNQRPLERNRSENYLFFMSIFLLLVVPHCFFH